MRNQFPATLPLPRFFFEGAAIFTSAAENIGNLWNEACKHGLKAGRRTNTYLYAHYMTTWISRKPQQRRRRQTRKARRCDVIYTNMAAISCSGFTSCLTVCRTRRCTCCASRVCPWFPGWNWRTSPATAPFTARPITATDENALRS